MQHIYILLLQLVRQVILTSLTKGVGTLTKEFSK